MTLLLLSTADTDLLAARSVPEPALELRLANPARVDDPVALLDLVGDLLVFLEVAGSTALNLGVVDKDVRATVVGGNEAKSLFRVKPLYSAVDHGIPFFESGEAVSVLRVDRNVSD